MLSFRTLSAVCFLSYIISAACIAVMPGSPHHGPGPPLFGVAQTQNTKIDSLLCHGVSVPFFHCHALQELSIPTLWASLSLTHTNTEK